MQCWPRSLGIPTIILDAITGWSGSTIKMLIAMIAVKIYKTSKQTLAMKVSRSDYQQSIHCYDVIGCMFCMQHATCHYLTSSNIRKITIPSPRGPASNVVGLRQNDPWLPGLARRCCRPARTWPWRKRRIRSFFGENLRAKHWKDGNSWKYCGSSSGKKI